MRVANNFSPYPFVAIIRFSTHSAHCSPEAIRFNAPGNDQRTDRASVYPSILPFIAPPIDCFDIVGMRPAGPHLFRWDS
jgi:hypothetical protein